MIPSGDIASAHASELELHRLALGELPAERRGQLEQHANGCARCAEALAALHGAHQAFDRDVHARTAPALAERAAGTWRQRRRAVWLWAMTAPAAVGLVVVALGVGGLLRGGPSVRPKGAADANGQPGLEVFALRGDRTFPATGGSELRPGDAIRFVLRRPAGLAHVMVAGVDAGGKVTVYHPYGKQASAPLDAAAGRLALDGSIVLDDSAGPERLFALFARQPFTLTAVSDALSATAAGGAAGLRRNDQLRAGTPVDGQASVLIERSGPR